MATPTLLDTMVRGIRASVTLDNINISNAVSGNINGRKAVGDGRLTLVGNKSATYEALYRTQPWIRATVDRIAGGVARLPWAAFMDADDPDAPRQRMREGALADLLEVPYERGTPTLLKQAIMKNLLIHENAIVVKHRERTQLPVSQLLPSSYIFWEIVPGADGLKPDWYVFHGDIGGKGAVIPFLPSEVIHFHTWGTGRAMSGDSRMEAVRHTLMVEDAAQRMIIAAFENGMRPVGGYSVEQQLKRETAERLRAQLNETYGGVDNAFKILLLEGGAKWQDMSHNFVDAEVSALRKMTREETTAVWNVPQPSVGILDHSTFSNVTEQHRMEYQDTDQPWTTLIEETLDVQMIREEPAMRGQYVEFNFKEVLRGDPIREVEVLQRAVGGPFMTPNEARATQNLGPIDGGDRLYPSPTTPGSSAPAERV